MGILCIFWKNKVCRFQNWENLIENLNEEEHGQLENEGELEAFKRAIHLLL